MFWQNLEYFSSILYWNLHFFSAIIHKNSWFFFKDQLRKFEIFLQSIPKICILFCNYFTLFQQSVDEIKVFTSDRLMKLATFLLQPFVKVCGIFRGRLEKNVMCTMIFWQILQCFFDYLQKFVLFLPLLVEIHDSFQEYGKINDFFFFL